MAKVIYTQNPNGTGFVPLGVSVPTYGQAIAAIRAELKQQGASLQFDYHDSGDWMLLAGEKKLSEQLPLGQTVKILVQPAPGNSGTDSRLFLRTAHCPFPIICVDDV